MTPGGPYGAEHAVVLPDNSQTMQMAANLLSMTENRRRYEQQRQQEEADRQDQLMMYMGREFDEKNFATGTPTDRVINDSLRMMKENYARMIKANPNMRLADLGYVMQGDIGKLNRYSVAAKTVRSNIDEVTKGLESDKSIDAKAIKMGALNKAFFKMNPETNQYELKDPDDIDLNADYVGEFMDEKPELWAKGRSGIDQWISGMKGVPIGESVTTDHGGVKNTFKWDADLLPFQKVKMGKDGKPEGLQVKGQAVKMPDGSSMEVLDEDVYQDMISNNRGAQGYIDATIKKHPVLSKLDKKGVEYKVAQRRLAFEMLADAPQNAAFRTTVARDESNWREKLGAYQSGVLNERLSKKDQEKELKSNPIEALHRIRTGDNDFMTGELNSKGMIDVTNRIPGSTLYSGKIKKVDGKAQPESYDAVLYNPADGEFYVADEFYNRNNPKKIENFDQWVKDIAEANGVPLKGVGTIRAKYHDGKDYKWTNPTSKAALRDLRIKEHNTDIEDELATFSVNPKEAVNSISRIKDVAGITDVSYSESFFNGPKISFKRRGSDKKETMTPAQFEEMVREQMIK
jgi:hypothetical protein